MVRIINGSRYDTEKAELIAEWDNGYPGNDFNSITEEIYRTKKGNWFMCGIGGANTGYKESIGNMSCEGSEIIPLDEESVMTWLEDKNETEAIEKYFGGEIEEA